MAGVLGVEKEKAVFKFRCRFLPPIECICHSPYLQKAPVVSAYPTSQAEPFFPLGSVHTVAPVVAPSKVPRRADRKLVLTVRSATARRRATHPLVALDRVSSQLPSQEGAPCLRWSWAGVRFGSSKEREMIDE